MQADGGFAVSLKTRIETFRFDLGRYPLEMMSNCRMEETMVLLVHKVVQSVFHTQCPRVLDTR